MLKSIILVGIGGGIGSILRFLTSQIQQNPNSLFPIKTLLVNVLGCLLIGFLFGLSEKNQLTNPYLKLLFITGFCGGFTTFSTFSLENFTLIQSGYLFTAIIYTILSVLLGLFALWIGVILTKMM